MSKGQILDLDADLVGNGQRPFANSKRDFQRRD